MKIECDLCGKELKDEFYIEKDYKETDEAYRFCRDCFEKELEGRKDVRIKFVWGDEVIFYEPDRNFVLFIGGGDYEENERL